ncbi:hypothetical protein N9M79_04580 [Alphaproteobacteria bacterium]|nr:hypothetical protein [Rhodobiaceae bacterium]MDA8712867.1 hypothetical protein [Alphaproteobacteria bacterium]MDB2523261.1 hypothetical protein [Alphaproteobacteria bacterium]RPF95304.1 MAG: hypothetical protein CBD22_003470 [Rhizobiales bacterium TMED162]HCL48805.1 hypothetical protein [Rhodobiaceae bacterium]
MFDVNLFNGAQILDQMIDFVALYLLTSQSAKTRFYGFALGLAGFAPATFLVVVTEMWWLVLCLPVWLAIELKGAVGNWRAAQGFKA